MTKRALRAVKPMKYTLNLRLTALIMALCCALGCLLSCGKKPTYDDLESNYSDSESNAPTEQSKESEDDAPILTIDEIAKKLKPSIVKVICYDFDRETVVSMGSGFFIDKNGTFITNAHVLDGCYYIQVQTYFGTVYDVDLMYTYNDIESDYAICGLTTEYSSRPVEFALSANAGDKVYALGYTNDSSEMSVRSGKIIRSDAVSEGSNYYTNTATIDHGSSGGALVDNRGRVLGITTGVASDGEYVALKYEDFKADADKKYRKGKEPARYFHNVREYKFAQGTMMLYFDSFANVVIDSDISVDFEVGAKLKDEFLEEKIVLDSTDATTITVTVKTTFDYYEIVGESAVHQVKEIDETVYLNFESLEELKKGKALPVTASIADSVPEKYYDMQISFDTSFWTLQTGSIAIYS